MSRLEETRESKTFAEQIGILIDYISPFKQMWPSYWLKIAAVRDPKASIWRLCYFALSGRWDDREPIREIVDRGDFIVAISQLIDATRAWEILASLRADGIIELSPDITASAILDPLFLNPSWQENILQMPKAVTDVAESADWRYLYACGRGTWSSSNIKWLMDDGDNNEFATIEYVPEERIRRASQPDLDKRGLPSLQGFESFASTWLGLDSLQPGLVCSIKESLYYFDLPLALRVDRGVPDRSANTLPLTIYCHRPLRLESIRISTGDIWLPSAETKPIDIEVSGEDGWSVGNIVVPYNCGKVWFESELLSKALPYKVTIPTPEDQIAEALGSIYHAGSVNQGKQKWKQHLLVSDGDDFEIALLNAIARFGIPVLFAGKLQKGGAATPGYDLVALNYTQQRAVLISAKGSPNNPSQEDCQKLLDAVESVHQMLQGWYITGILACHATNNKLGLAKMRNDLQIWSREDLEVLFQADKRGTIEYLLWRRPNLPGSVARWRSLHSY